MNKYLIDEIEKIIHLDPGGRGISATARNNVLPIKSLFFVQEIFLSLFLIFNCSLLRYE